MVQTMNEKLDKIVQIKESIRKSIVNKGQNLTTSDPFDIYPKKIDAIVTNQSEQPIESEDKFVELRQDLDIERPEDLDVFKSMKDLLKADTHEGNFKCVVLVKPIFDNRNNLVMNGFTLYDLLYDSEDRETTIESASYCASLKYGEACSNGKSISGFKNGFSKGLYVNNDQSIINKLNGDIDKVVSNHKGELKTQIQKPVLDEYKSKLNKIAGYADVSAVKKEDGL